MGSLEVKKFIEKYIGVIIFIIFIIATIAFIIISKVLCKKTDILDHYGSFMSGIFSVFSAFLVYLAFQHQKEGLEKTKEQWQQQQFETTFFNLLENHRELVKSLRGQWFTYDINNITPVQNIGTMNIFEGIRNIDECVNFLQQVIKGRINEIEFYPIESRYLRSELAIDAYNKSKLVGVEDIHKLYEAIFKKHRNYLGHYFRNLFHIVRFVDDYKGENKYNYIKVIRGQLSNSELILLAFNSISERGKPFQEFIKKYELLKNVELSKELGEVKGLSEKYPHFNQYKKGN